MQNKMEQQGVNEHAGLYSVEDQTAGWMRAWMWMRGCAERSGHPPLRFTNASMTPTFQGWMASRPKLEASRCDRVEFPAPTSPRVGTRESSTTGMDLFADPVRRHSR